MSLWDRDQTSAVNSLIHPTLMRLLMLQLAHWLVCELNSRAIFILLSFLLLMCVVELCRYTVLLLWMLHLLIVRYDLSKCSMQFLNLFKLRNKTWLLLVMCSDTSVFFLQVTPLAKQEEAPTITPNSDAEPRFELKGTVFNSDAPLSSSSTYCDVYTSEKINFL